MARIKVYSFTVHASREQAQRWARVARYLGCRSVSAWLEELAEEQAWRVSTLCPHATINAPGKGVSTMEPPSWLNAADPNAAKQKMEMRVVEDLASIREQVAAIREESTRGLAEIKTILLGMTDALERMAPKTPSDNAPKT